MAGTPKIWARRQIDFSGKNPGYALRLPDNSIELIRTALLMFTLS